MNQETIKKDFNEIFTKIVKKELTTLDHDTIRKCLIIKNYLLNYPHSDLSLMTKSLLAMYYSEKINNENLVKAFEITNKYQREIEVYKNLPLLDQANILFFNNTVIFPSKYYGSIPNYFNGLIWFIEKNGGKVDKNLKANIINFLEDNKKLFIYTKNNYSTLDEEISYHANALSNIFSKDYDEYLDREKGIALLESRYVDENKTYFNYLNRKAGNIGELAYFEYLKLLPQTYHVSKDYGDGFGYDIYSYDPKTEKEQLIEVKSTTNLDKEIFTLEENEYQKMIEAVNSKNAEYYVCLVYIDTLNNYKTTYQLLKATDEYTLESADQEIEYIKDHNFNKTTFIKNSYVKRR